MPDHYQMLGVEPSASRDDIRDAYRQLMQMIHPDRNPGNQQAEAWAQRVNAAYEVLSRPDLRAHYDRRRQPPSPEPGGPSGHGRHGAEREPSRASVPDEVLVVPLEVVDSGLVHEYRCDDGSRGRIRIPPGVENGERIPAMDTDGTPFNLIIEVERHDQFMRRGADLHTELPIHRADAEAHCGQPGHPARAGWTCRCDPSSWTVKPSAPGARDCPSATIRSGGATSTSPSPCFPPRTGRCR